MKISSDPWFSSVTEGWYGSTSFNFNDLWSAFLSSDDVKYLPASATDAEYRQLYLKFLVQRPEIAANILAANSWFRADTNALYAPAQLPLPSPASAIFQPTQLSVPTDAELLDLVQAFLALPEVLDLSGASIERYRPLFIRFVVANILASDTHQGYSNAIDQFCGTTLLGERRKIMFAFLSSPEVLSLPPLADAEDYARLFITFLTSSLNQTYRSEQATALSPEAIEQYKVLWSVFDILADMLTTTSLSQIRGGQTIRFATAKRQAYVDMLTRTPIYKGTGIIDLNEADTWVVPQTSKDESTLPSSTDFTHTKITENTDPTKFVLGYGGVTVNDISEWLYHQYTTAATDANPPVLTHEGTFTLYSGDFGDESTPTRNRITLHIYEENGAPKIEIKFQQDLARNDDAQISEDNLIDSSQPGAKLSDPTEVEYNTINWSQTGIDSITTPYEVGHSITSTDKKTIVSTINSSFQELWTSAKGIMIEDRRTPKIPWQSGVLATQFTPGQKPSDEEKSTLSSRNLPIRSQRNQRLSAYTSAISSRIEGIKNLSDQQQQLINASAEGQKAANNTIVSILQMMQQILASIFA